MFCIMCLCVLAQDVRDLWNKIKKKTKTNK